MVIAHNISALNTYKSLGIAGNQADNSMEKLSSGYKINKAADDAAGLSISEKMRSQIRGLNQAATNAENGVSMIQTAEGALNEEHAILQRMRELAVQSATDTNAKEDREALQSEMAQLTSEINRIGATTEFNGMKILDGSKAMTTEGGAKSVTLVGGAYWEALTPGTAGNLIQVGIFEDNDVTSPEVSVTQYNKYTRIGVKIHKHDTESYSNITLDELRSVIANDPEASKLVRIINDSNVGNLKNYPSKQDTYPISYTGSNYYSLQYGEEPVKVDNSVYFHVGANSNQVINTEFNDMRAEALGIVSKVGDNGVNFFASKNVNNGTDSTSEEYSLNITTREGANNAIDVIDAAIKKVSDERSKYGAIQNRLEYTINNLNTTAENMTAAESTIRDVDMADEMMSYTKNNILQQAAQAMLVQANARPQQALQLLQ